MHPVPACYSKCYCSPPDEERHSRDQRSAGHSGRIRLDVLLSKPDSSNRRYKTALSHPRPFDQLFQIVKKHRIMFFLDVALVPKT
jgi:hypothetical protein